MVVLDLEDVDQKVSAAGVVRDDVSVRVGAALQ